MQPRSDMSGTAVSAPWSGANYAVNVGGAGGVPTRRRLPPRPLTQDPSYVRACEEQAWSLALWRRDGQPLDEAGTWWRSVCYRCVSWRHGGDCARQRAIEDIRRIQAGLADILPEDLVYLVLTWDQKQFGGDFATAYRGILRCWARMRKRLTRRWGPLRYVAVAERHASGFPHLNVIIANPDLGSACAGDGWKQIRTGWLRESLVECGFGPIAWLEPVRSKTWIAYYVAKLAGEIGKASQVPIEAPPHFRRLRASQGLLPPPPPPSAELTGRFIKKSVREIDQSSYAQLPAYAGRPVECDRAEAGAEDGWYAMLDEVELEPGVRSYAVPYTREVLWVSYDLRGAAGEPPPEAPDTG
jgi:hypothetical protein